MKRQIYLKGENKQVIISTLKTVIAEMERPAQTLETDAVAVRFNQNPKRVCQFCGKRTTTALNHYECELRSYGDDLFIARTEMERMYFDVV